MLQLLCTLTRLVEPFRQSSDLFFVCRNKDSPLIQILDAFFNDMRTWQLPQKRHNEHPQDKHYEDDKYYNAANSPSHFPEPLIKPMAISDMGN